MLTICVAHAARSVIALPGGGRLELFPRTVRSLCAAVAETGIRAELLIADWPGYEDLAPLANWLQQEISIPHRVIEHDGAFNKGLALNDLARQAGGPHLFFLDADMLVPAEVLRRGVYWLQRGRAWFPGYLAQARAGSRITNPPKNAAGGNAFMSVNHWRACGGWPEQEHWGGFDRPVWTWLERRGLSAESMADREPVPGFVHLWHPKKLGWKEKVA